ncbi:YdgA family protein [Pseudidiomarina salilacus]|uniref:YdgA family protein n=1 Tax=Pseudidiomarina salilacus TaxID=3384452 RepID=UPI0039852C8E
MSKKGIAIGAVVVIGGLFASPYFIGSQAESNVREYVALFDQEQPGYSAEVVSFERGWFSSNAVIRVGLDLATLLSDPTVKPLATDIDLSIQHGPVLTDNGFSAGLAAWQTKVSGAGLEAYVKWDQQQPLYLQQGSVSLGGTATYQDYIPRLVSTDAIPELEFALSEYRGDGTYQTGSFAYQGNYEQLTMNIAAAYAVELNAMVIEATANADLRTMIAGDFYPMDMTFIIGQTQVSAAEELLFTMSQLTSDIALKVSEDESLAHVHMGYGAEQVVTGGVEVTAIRSHTEINNISKPFIDAYLDVIKDTMGEDDPEVLMQAMSNLVETHKEALLMAQPEFAISDMGFTMEQGTMNASMRMGLAELEQVPAQLNEQFLIENMQATAHMDIAKPLAVWLAKTYVKTMLEANGQAAQMDAEQLEQMATQQAAMMLNSFATQGLLKSEGDTYVLDVELAKGLMNLNGQSMPLGQMM